MDNKDNNPMNDFQKKVKELAESGELDSYTKCSDPALQAIFKVLDRAGQIDPETLQLTFTI